MKNKLILSLTSLSLLMSGCNMLKVSDRSLDYRQAKNIKPLEIPDGMSMRKETPLYPAPIIEQMALDNAPRYENSHGNRYQLPRPSVKMNANHDNYQLDKVHPHFIYDGNKNPLLQMVGDTQPIWRYVLATVNSLNYKTTVQEKRNSAIIEKDEKQYMLLLSQVGTTHVLALYELDGRFAPQTVAEEVLTQIYQNWPI